MKKCPQCEFLYEDEQRLCDMDGTTLVADSRNLPNLNALANSAPVKNWRARAVPVVAGMVLATVLGLVYYVQTQQTRSVALVPAPAASVASPASPVAQPTTSPVEEIKPAEEPVVKPKPSSEATKPPKKAKPKKPTTKVEKRKDSKLSALLKKTGQFFKKPFSK